MIAVCINDPDSSPFGIHGRDTAQTPAGFAETVSDDFPVPRRPDRASLVQESGAYSVLLFLAEFLEARIGPQRIEHWIEPEQRRSERARRERAGVRDRE